jgi:hypothetical protein
MGSREPGLRLAPAKVSGSGYFEKNESFNALRPSFLEGGNFMQRSPLELEEIWCERVRKAKGRYALASAQFMRALEEQKVYPIPAPDGSCFIRYARLLETQALMEYMRVLRIYSDLAVPGAIPLLEFR